MSKLRRDPYIQNLRRVMSNIYVTREIPQHALEYLQERADVVDVNPNDRILEYEEFLGSIAGRDGVLCTLNNKVDATTLDAAPGVKVFANFAVGYNNIDVAAATERGVVITNTPGVLTDATADLAWALLFATARRVVEADEFLRAGHFKGWAPMMYLGADITGSTLGIIGAGRIGTAMGLRASAFRMKVIYCNSSSNSAELDAQGARRVEMDELLSESDFISIHAPFNEKTNHLIGREELAQMKSTAHLINTARGQIVDETALVEALQNGVIAGAGLDVFEDEPALKPGLTELKNVVILPHIGSATIGTRTKMALMAAGNIMAVLDGERPENPVNLEVLE
jgi:lactate dehydrogenase-like 2-hydroxyacid dehydrogenase